MSEETKKWIIKTDKQKAALKLVFDQAQRALTELQGSNKVMPFFTECPVYRKHLTAIQAMHNLLEACIAEEERAEGNFL